MVVIIGAGPIGCYLGGLLARSGKEVSIYEEHSSIGSPVQCAGIVTQELGKIIRLKDNWVINRLDNVKVFSKNNHIMLPSKDIVIDRKKFDNYLAKKAEKYGANIFLNHKFIGVKGKYAVFTDKDKRFIKIKADYIIGADGPLSDTAKSSDLFQDREFFFGMQARIKGKYDSSCYETYFGSICPGFFAWIIPK